MARFQHYRQLAEAAYDAADEARKRDIQAAWATGWRFGFGPVKPEARHA